MRQTKTFQLRPLIRWILWVLLIQFLLGNISAAIYAYKFTHFYRHGKEWNVANANNIIDKTWMLYTGPYYSKPVNKSVPSFPYRQVRLTTKNNIAIDAWYASRDSAKGVVAIFHGLNTTKSYYLPEAEAFYGLGYNVFLLDFRAHGNSGGRQTSIGYFEAEEINLAFRFLKEKGEQKIILYGGSMGGVAIARAISAYQILPSAVILDFPFDGLTDHLRGRAKGLGFPPSLFALPVAFWMGVENNYPVFTHKTRAYAKSIHCPVLLQWGTNDFLVKKEETEAIYTNIKTGRKKLVVYEGGAHYSLLQQQPLLWHAEINRFLAPL